MIQLKTKPLVSVSVIIVVAILGVLVIYELAHKSAPTPATVKVAPAKSVPLDPTAAVSELPSFTNKTITLRGRILQSSQGGYLIVGTVPSSGSAVSIPLDFSKSHLDPSQYADNGPPSKTTHAPPDINAKSTVTGKLVMNGSSQPVVVVSTVSR